jgi:hypothetical protein
MIVNVYFFEIKRFLGCATPLESKKPFHSCFS